MVIPTDVSWSVIFIQIDNLSRHPSQLYEAVLEGVILFIILIYFRKKRLSKKTRINFWIIFNFLFNL